MQREDTAMIHEGRNVKRIREMLGVKQEALAMDLGISQQAVSALEQREVLDKEMLQKVANVLRISPEAIKNFSEDNVINIFSNSYSDHASTIYNNFNPLEMYVGQVEENKRLYEALLKSEREKIALLERMLNERK
jgi:transcriptional regulator with XRE-family HTH domain